MAKCVIGKKCGRACIQTKKVCHIRSRTTSRTRRTRSGKNSNPNGCPKSFGRQSAAERASGLCYKTVNGRRMSVHPRAWPKR